MKWRRRWLALATLVVTAHPRMLGAQIGRFPLLEEITDSAAKCRRVPAPDDFRRAGAVLQIQIKPLSDTSRVITLGVTATGRAETVHRRDRACRRLENGDGNTDGVSRLGTGAVVSGSRTYETSGTASRIKDDKRSALFPRDTARIVSLAREAARRC